jgi:hypothetical protein
MLQADLITQFLQCKGNEPVVFEFPVAGEVGGIKDDVIVNVCTVYSRSDPSGTARWIFPYSHASQSAVSPPSIIAPSPASIEMRELLQNLPHHFP